MYVFGYSYLGDGDTDRREILRDGTYWSLTHKSPLLEALSPGPQGVRKILNVGRLKANISKTVSRSVTCQLELNDSSMRTF